MKKLTLVLIVIAFMLGAVPIPGTAPISAFAQRPGIGFCTGDVPTSSCWNVRGIAADMRVANWDLGCPGGHNDSLYISAPGADVTPSIEFGWGQDRYPGVFGICSYTNREMFMLAYDDQGNQVFNVTFNITSYGTGKFRLLMYQNATSPGIMRFAFDDPNGVRHVLNTTINMSTVQGFGAATTGNGLTTMEIINENSDKVVQSALPYHRNVWVLNGNYLWKPANEANSDEMRCWDDGLALWKATVTRNTGTTGDHITYSRVAGDTC